MEDLLLKETFLYGNLYVSYYSEKGQDVIKKIDLKKIKQFLTEIVKDDIDLSFIWRMHYNFSVLFNKKTLDIYNEPDLYHLLIDIYQEYITILEEFLEVEDKKITKTPETCKDYFKISVYSSLVELANILKSSNIKEFKDHFKKNFKEYIVDLKKKNVFIEYESPLLNKEGPWIPSWQIVYDYDNEKEIVKLDNIDYYIDSHFLSKEKLKYSQNVLSILTERLTFLKKKTDIYYREKIKPKLKQLSKNIFDTFPYQIIYKYYYDFMQIDETIRRPEITEWKDGIGWMLSIIPLYITAFLLGYPVISSDIPIEKNIIPRIRKIVDEGIDEYIKDVRSRNRTIIEAKKFDIEIKNHQDEEDDYIDLCYEKIVDYNMDDVLFFYNCGVIHIFSASEFDNIIKTQMNPYNRNNIPKDIISLVLYGNSRDTIPRDKIPMISILSRNQDYKDNIRAILAERGLQVTFKSTMKNNIEELLEAMDIEKMVIKKREQKRPTQGYDVPLRPFGDLMFLIRNSHY